MSLPARWVIVQQKKSLCATLTARHFPTHTTPPIMDEYLFIISVHKSGCQSPAHPARRCLICIGRLRRRERNEVGLRVGDGGGWWIELSPHHGTFVNVWLVLNGLLLDYRVWGPNLDTGSATRRQSLTGVPWQNGRRRVDKKSEKREEGGGHACLCRVVKMFDNAADHPRNLTFSGSKGRKRREVRDISWHSVDGQVL